MLDFPLCQISSWNANTCLALRSCPGQLLFQTLFIFHSFSLSTSPFCTFSWNLLPQVTSGDPGWHILARVAVQVFTQKFPSVFRSPIKHKSGGPEKIHCWYRDITSRPSKPHTSHWEPVMLTSWPPHIYWDLCGPIFDSNINTFSTTFTWWLSQELADLQQTPPGWSGL